MQRATQPAPIPSPPMPGLADLTGGLRTALRSAAESATGTPELAAFLDARLDELEAQGRLDQGALALVVDETATRLREAGLGEVASLVVRRLLRCVYEFLRAVDARSRLARPPRSEPLAPSPPPRPDRSAEAESVEVLVRRGHLEEAATALDALSARGAGHELVAVALEAGDRCRADGLARAASLCYGAAWTADRLDERPLWRLASIALDGGDIELALSYLRQLVALLRWRGDARGVARIYRKMSMLVPEPGQAALAAPPSSPEPVVN